jgi:hypothetical protein
MITRIISWARVLLMTVAQIPPAHVTCVLYVWLAVNGFLLAQLTGPEARKFICPLAVFILGIVFGVINVGLLALKMFLDKSYAEYRQDKEQTK